MSGMTSEGAKTYEAWLRRQPTADLREMLTDPELDDYDTALIQRIIAERSNPQR